MQISLVIQRVQDWRIGLRGFLVIQSSKPCTLKLEGSEWLWRVNNNARHLREGVVRMSTEM